MASYRDPGDPGCEEPVIKILNLEMQKKKKERILKGPIGPDPFRNHPSPSAREEITTQMLAFWCQMLPQPLLRGREEEGKFLIAARVGGGRCV